MATLAGLECGAEGGGILGVVMTDTAILALGDRIHADRVGARFHQENIVVADIAGELIAVHGMRKFRWRIFIAFSGLAFEQDIAEICRRRRC